MTVLVDFRKPIFSMNWPLVSEIPYVNVACNPLTLPANITSVSALIQPLGFRDREYCFWTYYPQLGPDIESAVNEKVRTLCSARFQVV